VIKNICVYCSSSDTLDKSYYDAAEILGGLLASNGFSVVYGGSCVGTMHTVASTAKKNGAKIIGVMPEKLFNFGVSSDYCDEFYKTIDMRSRKQKLDEVSDAVVAMAGGFGTLEEVSEMIVQKQLGYNNKPIVFLNTNGFYNKLFEFFENIMEQQFAKSTAKDLYYDARTPQDVIEYLLNYRYVDKVIEPKDIYTSIQK
jgi:hypothetical protein